MTTVAELREIFLRARAQFSGTEARHASLQLVDKPCGPSNRCGKRDVAWCYPRTLKVCLLTRGLQLSRVQLAGLMLHELGHLADPYVEHHGRERRADAIALALTGRRVRYDGEDIQTTGRGRVTRPRHLHQ